MRNTMLAATLGMFVGACAGAAAADGVGDVHDLALRTARAAGTPPGPQGDTLTVVDLAMFDAANAVERRFRPYRTHAGPPPPPGTDANAAAIGAGCAALAAWHPEQQPATARACDALYASLPSSPAQASSIAFGQDAGRAIVAARRAEIRPFANAYRPNAAPGSYVATPLPIGADVATLSPFALRTPSQLRPGPPPPLTSDTWARDYNESKAFGGRKSTLRTPAQTATALYWSSVGPQQLLDSISGLPLGDATSPAAHARFLALITMALSDASIAVFDAKYAYEAWRPVTAIRNGDKDGNDATERDAEWAPLLETPLHQEYPCAHCAATAAIVGVMSAGGDDFKAGVVVKPATAAAQVAPREFQRAADVLAEVANARVWGGMHFRFSTDAGTAIGRAAARWVLDTQLLPEPLAH